MVRLILLMLVLSLVASARAQTSRGGDFTAAVSRTTHAKNSRDHNTWSASIVDRQNRARYQVVKQVAFDVQYPALYLSDDGSCVVASGFTGDIEFYDRAGNLTKTLQPFGHATTEYEQVIKCSVAADRVAVLCSSPEQSQSKLMMTNLQGNELWRVDLIAKNAGEVFLSSDGKTVAAGSYDVEKNNVRLTQTFDAQGTPLQRFDILFRYSDVASDGRIVLADRDNILVASLRGDESPVTWSRSSGDLITGVTFVDDFVALVVESITFQNGVPVYNNPSLIVLNRKGEKIAGTQLRTSSPGSAGLIVDETGITLKSSSSQVSISRSSLKQE